MNDTHSVIRLSQTLTRRLLAIFKCSKPLSKHCVLPEQLQQLCLGPDGDLGTAVKHRVPCGTPVSLGL